MELLIYLLVGAFSGVIAGLFGVGGGVVIVPALVFTFAATGVSEAISTHMAVATSLAVIVVTSISSVRAHHQRGAVRWPLVAQLVPGIVLGVVLGVHLADRLSGATLQLLIGSFLLLVALQMGLGLMPDGRAERASGATMVVAGGVIGTLSAMFGIGGGTLTVPFLSYWRVVMQQAVATSAACGLPIALVGAVTNGVVGWQHPLLPEYSVGFVYLPAFLGLALASAPCAKIGAALAHRLSAQRLKQVFAVFLVLIGIQFILRNL